MRGYLGHLWGLDKGQRDEKSGKEMQGLMTGWKNWSVFDKRSRRMK